MSDVVEVAGAVRLRVRVRYSPAAMFGMRWRWIVEEPYESRFSEGGWRTVSEMYAEHDSATRFTALWSARRMCRRIARQRLNGGRDGEVWYYEATPAAVEGETQ